MKFQKIRLTAGVGTPIGITGTYFRVLSGTQDFRVSFQFTGGRSQYDTLFKVGIGVQLPEKFTAVTMESEVDQVVEIAYSIGRIDDSRLVGTINTSVTPASSYGEELTAVSATTATKVVSANGNRITGTLVADVDGYLWHDNTVSSAPGSTKGIPYVGGSLLQISNTAELWFHSQLAGNVTLLEELT